MADSDATKGGDKPQPIRYECPEKGCGNWTVDYVGGGDSTVTCHRHDTARKLHPVRMVAAPRLRRLSFADGVRR